MEREGIIGIHQRSIVIYHEDQLETLAQQEVTQHTNEKPGARDDVPV